MGSSGERQGGAPWEIEMLRHRAQGRGALSSSSSSSCCKRSTKGKQLHMSVDRRALRSPQSRSPIPGSAFASAAFLRGGQGIVSPLFSESGALPTAPANTSSLVETVRGGGILLDEVEDRAERVVSAVKVVAVPAFHILRFAFGLALTFYGMAFRTFAFHVIVFRIAGLKQVQRSLGQIGSRYRSARKSIREAAAAAESVGGRVFSGDELKAAREKMIQEKKRLLSDGYLSAEETRYFMKKFNSELLKIKEEQDRFRSARSSIFSVRTSVDPKLARTSLGGLYSALIASFTASTIQTAGQMTLGFHVGSLLKTHILDLFGPILDPIGYRLDLDTYYDKEDIPYMGKANAMDGPSNLAMNILCYSVVFAVFKVHPSIALKASMVYYGARVVTDYIILATEPFRRKFGQMTIVHTPWSAVIHAGLAIMGFYHHRNYMTEGLFGPGVVGLVEPLVRVVAKVSHVMHGIDFFTVKFVSDPVEMVKEIVQRRS